jgi:hypothetical protein
VDLEQTPSKRQVGSSSLSVGTIFLFQTKKNNIVYRVLAQLGERLPYKQGVAGSSPAYSTIINIKFTKSFS